MSKSNENVSKWKLEFQTCYSQQYIKFVIWTIRNSFVIYLQVKFLMKIIKNNKKNYFILRSLNMSKDKIHQSVYLTYLLITLIGNI